MARFFHRDEYASAVLYVLVGNWDISSRGVFTPSSCWRRTLSRFILGKISKYVKQSVRIVLKVERPTRQNVKKNFESMLIPWSPFIPLFHPCWCRAFSVLSSSWVAQNESTQLTIIVEKWQKATRITNYSWGKDWRCHIPEICALRINFSFVASRSRVMAAGERQNCKIWKVVCGRAVRL